MLSLSITENEMEEYKALKRKNTPMRKRFRRGGDGNLHCPVCWYVVDTGDMPQFYCGGCGQRLEGFCYVE